MFSDGGAQGDGASKDSGSSVPLNLTLPSLELRSAALSLAAGGDDTRGSATRALHEAYRHLSSDLFLAPALVDAVGVIALRSAFGRSALRDILLHVQELTEGDPDARYLAISALRAAGQSKLIADDDVRAVVQRLTTHDDALVQAEARMQLAYGTLCCALQANAREQLLRTLQEAQVGFARARASEEHRPDAAAFECILEAVLAFASQAHDCDTLLAGVSQAIENWVGLGLASDRANRIAFRIVSIAAALQRIREAIGEADSWLRFDEALLHLATLVVEWQLASAPSEVEQALAQLSPALVVPTLGPLLSASVSRARFERVILDAERNGQPAHVLEALRGMFSGLVAQRESREALTPEHVGALEALAKRRDLDVANFVSELCTAVKAGDSGYLTRMLPSIADVPLDHPTRYAALPSVDELATRLIHDVHERGALRGGNMRGAFQRALVTLLEWMVEERNGLPPYLMCENDGGLGQRATESEVQNSAFRRLRHDLGWEAGYEPAHLAGGRSDVGICVTGRYFPIEAKREFVDVSREHIRATYVAQTDAYAAATDGIGFLIVLDLRESNASAHNARGSSEEPRAMYSLADSAWVESLPADEGVSGAKPNTIIVLLVPGNRPKPSSMSTYSRPRARKQRQRR